MNRVARILASIVLGLLVAVGLIAANALFCAAEFAFIAVDRTRVSLMAAAGLLTREKRGQSVYYGMKDPLILKVCALVHTQLAD